MIAELGVTVNPDKTFQLGWKIPEWIFKAEIS
jgi:hypothetical protein